MLEDSVTVPLYKTTMHRPSGDDGLLERNVTGPKAISVSKTHQLVGLFTLILWAGLLIYSVIQTCPTWITVSGEILFGLLTAVFLRFLYGNAATYEDDQHHIARKRRTFIVDP